MEETGGPRTHSSGRFWDVLPFADKGILRTNENKLSFIKLQLQLPLNKKYQDSPLPLIPELPSSPQKGAFPTVPMRTVKSRLRVLSRWLEGELHPAAGNALLVGTGREGVKPAQSGQLLTWSGLGCGDRQGQG